MKVLAVSMQAAGEIPAESKINFLKPFNQTKELSSESVFQMN